MPFILDVAVPLPLKAPIPISSFYINLNASIPDEVESSALRYHHPSYIVNMGGGGGSSSSSNAHTISTYTSVSQALEIARDSEEGSRDPVVIAILENALARIWSKVQAQPSSYVMTRDEFAVFNYFQSRFTGNTTAIEARRRYWDHFGSSSGRS